MYERVIRITAGAVSAEARLHDSPAARGIWEALPLEARAQTWGDEIYFDIGLDLPQSDPREVVEMGDLGYWPPGQAFCIFFGPTPASRGAEIRPASAVTVVGRVRSDATAFRAVRSGARVRLERAGTPGGTS